MRRWIYGLFCLILAMTFVRGADEKTVADNERRVTELVAALKAKDAAARKDAAKALAEMGVESCAAAPTLGEAVLDDDLDVRREAARALIYIGRPAVSVLMGILKEKDRNARKLAAEALGAIGSPARPAVQTLVNLAQNGGDKATRRAALYALGRMGWGRMGSTGSEVVPVLMEARRKRTRNSGGPLRRRSARSAPLRRPRSAR